MTTYLCLSFLTMIAGPDLIHKTANKFLMTEVDEKVNQAPTLP
jgi:hypothetical protein